MTNQQKTEHELPSSISEENPFQLQQLATRSSQSLPRIIETNTDTTSISFNDIQKEFDRISHLKTDPTSPSHYSIDLTNSDPLSSIPYIDSSSLDDQEISERKYSSSNINRKISLSETDLLSSLHRNLNNHDTTDDILFLEWDKERNLFQDYINSLRKEIRVLLQERLEYQTENKHISDDQMKIDLLQKSLEEKNFVLEQLQIEYELIKDKNINSIRKISLLQCDAKSYVGIIDELKQKIADLTVDLQNHIIIKRRLEISINNLETDCKIIDAERIRLTNDIKENQHKKQDSEKLLQKANVQIAEQGSTIEMLRSENVQVRSQLSTIQRRMFQEKQQIMDYLRQIENDLIEKEQIKQRESLLRQDYEQLQFSNKQDRKEIEQLKNFINKDQQKIKELQDECSQLLITIQTQNEEKIQLESQFDTYKSEILEDQYHIIQSPVQSTLELPNEHNQLRQELESLTDQCKQLNEANQAWQQYQQNQLMILHDRFKLSNTENLSFDDLVQQIENRLSNLQNECDTLADRVIELQAIPTNNDITRSDNDTGNELQQNLEVLTSQCAQLNEANRAWQQFHQAQLDNFRNKLQNSLPIENTFSFDEIAQLISDHIHQLVNERDILIQNLHTTEQFYSVHQNGPTNDINAIDEQLNKRSTVFHPELSTFYPTKRADLTPSEDVSIHHLTSVQSALSPIVEHNEELWENLATVSTDQFSQQTPIDILRNQVADCLSLDYNVSFDQIIEQLVDEIKRERKESNERYELLERANRDLRSESDNNMETIRQSYLNAVNELNQELLATKEQYEQLDAEKQLLNNQLENRSDQQNASQIIESSSSDLNLENVNQQLLFEKQTFNENSIDDNQLRQDYILLQNQCTQLDIANRAWQLFYDNQMDLLTNKFKDYFDFDNNHNFDQIIEMIAAEFNQQNQSKDKIPSDSAAIIDSLQKQLENFQYNESILAQNLEQLNQKLHDVYKQCEEFREHNAQLILSKQQVDKQLEERENQIKLLVNNSNQYTQSPIDGIPVDNVNQDQELNQLRIDLAALTTQCAQLDEANRAWQQYQPAQLHHLQNKFQDYLPLYDNISFEELSQMIHDQIIKEREDFNQRYQTLQKTNDDLRLESVTNLETINELTQQLEKSTAHLPNQQQSNDLPKQTSDEIPFELTRLNDQEETIREDVSNDPIDILRNHLEDCLSLDYNVSFDQIVEQLVDKIKRERKEFNEHYEHLERENRDLRLESDANMESIRESCLDTIKELNQELFDIKEQCKEFDRMNKQLIIENEIFTNQLSDRSIAIRHHSTSPTEELHLRSTIISNHNKVNSINTIDKEIQTESIHQLWSNFSDEKSLNIDEDNEYINEISSLSSIDISNKLNKECQQILSKQNFELTSLPNLDPNQLSLIALHSLYNQHLTDEAKQLYNETVIRALKQEYELINNEKNDFIEKSNELIELERLHSTQTINDLIEKYESQLQMNSLHLNEENKKLLDDQFEQLGKEYYQLKRDFNEITAENELLKDYNAKMYHEKLQENDSIEIKLSHDVDIQCELTQSSNTEDSNWNNDWTDQNLIKQTVDNETQTDSQQPDKLVQVNNKLKRALQTIKDKINRLVIEQPELFPISTDDTIVRLDSLISAIEQQAAQIDILKTKAITSTPIVSEEEINQAHEDKLKENQEIHNLKSQLAERNHIKSSQTMDNETQTDDQQPDRLVQINNKLKRALQNIKEKVHRVVVERPELFPNSTDDTIERLDYLISAIENQAAQIESLQQQKDQETNLLRERLNEVEIELTKTLDDHTLTMNKYQSLVEERTALVQQQSLQSEEYEHTIEQLREEVAQQKRISIIKQAEVPSHEEIKSLKQIIEQQTEELRDLMEKNLFQDELNQQKKEIEQRFNERENQIDNLMQERARLLEEIEKNALPVIHTTDSDTQTDDHQHEKLVQLNNKLKRVLQGFKDKIHRVVAERPDLFDGVSNETSERLDHLISAVENQTTQMHALQAERDQLRNEMKQLQCSFETYQKELDDERQIKMEQLVSSTPSSDTISSSTLEDYQKQIDQLTQNLSQKDEEQSLLRDHLNEVEVQLRKTLDDQASTINQYQSLLEQSGREVAQLKEEISELKHIADYQHVEVQTDEDVKALHEMIEDLKDLNEKHIIISSQFESQIENLNQERARLLEEIETYKSSPVVKTDSDTQTDDPQYEKLVQLNNKLKRLLQVFKDKVHRIVAERPDLFDNIGEETSERLDHLISTVENQATQIDSLQIERDQTNEKYQHQIKELQSSLDACQYELDHERQIKMEQLVSSAPSDTTSSTPVEDYQKEIDQLQQVLSHKNEEQSLLQERLNKVELELRKTLDDHVSTMIKSESLKQERDELIEQQTLQSAESQRAIEQLKSELIELKQSPITQHVEIQTDEEREHKTSDNETQTDDEDLLQTKDESKRALQAFVDKIHHIAAERPDLFDNISEETNARLDHLISTVENQATQINILDADCEQQRKEIKELQSTLESYQKDKIEQVDFATSPDDIRLNAAIIEKYQNQIELLQQNLAEKDEERTLLGERLNGLELELQKTIDNHELTVNKCDEDIQYFTQERNALIEQQALRFAECEREIEQLKTENDQIRKELADLKKSPDCQHIEIQTDEDIKTMDDLIEHQTNELRTLKESYRSLSFQIDSNAVLQAEANRQRNEMEEQMNVYKNQIEKNTLVPAQTIEHGSQTDDQQHEKLGQLTNELKNVLQGLTDKIHHIAAEKPELFHGIGEEANDCFDRLISTVENQTTQMHALQTERDQLRNEMKQLQCSFETYQKELDDERQIKMEQLVSSTPSSDTISSSTLEDYQNQIDQLTQNLSQKDEEQSLLRDHLNEIEVQLRKTLDDHTSTINQYQSLLEQSGREVAQLKEEISELKHIPDYQHVEVQTDEDVKALHEMIKHLKDLNEKQITISSQFESQIENLMQERATLLEEIETYKSSPVVQADNDTQTDDPQYEKLVDSNNELKHTLQVFNDKVHRIVAERPDLFDNIGEETSERLDHLISTVENQTTKIDVLQTEMKELRSSLEACQYELDNERRMKIEQLVSASTIIEDYQKQLDQLQKNLCGIDAERTLLRERLNEVELQLQKTLDDHTSIMRKNESLEQEILRLTESQHEIAQLREELTNLKQSPEYHHVEIQTDEDMKSLHEMIEQLKDLNEKNLTLQSQVELTNQRLNEHENLLKELEKNTSLSNQTTNTDDEHEELLAINKKLKSAIETIETKIDQIFTTRADLSGDIGKETDERLDSLISAVQNQATELHERNQANEKYQRELNELQNSFDMYRQQLDNEYHIKLDEHISSLSHEIDSPINPNRDRIENKTALDLNESNDWFDASPEITITDMTEYDRCQDIDIQCELQNIPLSLNHNSTQTDFDSFSFQNKIKELQSSFDIYGNEIENEHLIKMEPSNNVNTQTLGLSMSEEYQKQIEQLQENEIFYQREIERLIEERDQAQDLVSQWKEENKKRNDQESSYELKVRKQDNSSSRSLNNSESQTSLDVDSNLSDSRISNYQSQIDDLLHERLTLMEKIKQLTSQPSKSDIESQPINNINLLSSSNQSISRHIFEQEMLAWSKESEELKRLVKQIQIENKKLKDIIHKFERMVLDYVHENERLKQENQHLSLNNYSTLHKIHETETFTNSDKDICSLTLKWLTYEVAQRTSNNNEQSVLLINDSEQGLKQRYNDTERQIKNICLQNERLKNQLETYTIQFNHLQHEMSIKIQEISTVKDETERLRVSEIQCRLEADHLKSELQDDQLKIQQLERDLFDIKLKQSSNDANSIDNLRELLELKERELNALKDKLDYTKQAHQTELQEAIKANQFSLENVKRYEQMESRYKEKQRELETRIGKFCKITRPLINNQELFIQNPIINIDELRKLIAEADTEEKITNSLSPIRDCLSMLEAQMKDLHHSIIENHARRSKRWKYKLGFECLSCESRWEVTHDVRDLQMACLDPSRFLESSIVEPMAGCSCPIIDFLESDVRMCVDDILNEVITRTTVK